MHTPKTAKTNVTTIRLSSAALDRFENEAWRRGVSRSALLRLVLTHYLTELDKIPAAEPGRLFE